MRRRNRHRYVPTAWAPMEITVRVLQGRHLLRPSAALNRILAGVVAKALQSHDIRLHALVAMSNHVHMILSPANVRELSRFMQFVNGRLSDEIGRLHDWPGTMWHGRYTSTPISDEAEAQVARLKYLLSNSCKEGLVLSPLDWPGIHSARALTEGVPIRGVWIDRTGHHRARARGEDVTPEDFEEHVEIHLAPLPCWKHLDTDTRRGLAADLVQQVEQETLEMHRRHGTVPLGATKVKAVDPHQRKDLEATPKPRFHAIRKEVRVAMTEAWSGWLQAYAEAADRLRAGHPRPGFPPDCHPPPLPYVPPLGAT